MDRIVVVGCTGSGKTTLARELARRLGVAHVELDALHWAPGWTEEPDDVMRERVRAAVAADAWVVDGNYTSKGMYELIWRKADRIVWLDYPLATSIRRVVWRSIRRAVTRQELWHGNRENLTGLFGRDSLVVWAMTSRPKQKREYPDRLAGLDHVRLRSPRQTARWLRTI